MLEWTFKPTATQPALQRARLSSIPQSWSGLQLQPSFYLHILRSTFTHNIP